MRRFGLLLLVLFGCEESGLELEPTDAGMRDAGSRDAGLRDAGSRDAGTPDAGGPACLVPAIGFSADAPDAERPTMFDYEGLIVIRSVDPLIVADTSTTGERWRITVAGNVFDDGIIHVGDIYDGRIRIRAPFWTEVEVLLAYPNSSTPVLWFWNQSVAPRAFAGLRPVYSQTDCTFDQCGIQATQRLAISAGGESLVLDALESGTLASYALFNGLSAELIGPATCTDTPLSWYSGWIAAPPQSPEPDCALDNDACIAARHCVLYGSMTSDPGYSCVRAASVCERHPTEGQCVAEGCAWDPGACYCPAGETCVCEGGPAPKCREICGTARRYGCPDGRFCDLESCDRDPRSPGVCDLVPQDCDGAPQAPVCACSRMRMRTTYANDCERRADYGVAASVGACP